MAKSYEIPKQLVYQAYMSVKANKGSSGVDKETLEIFEQNLKGNLYKIWNRMSSGSYFPPQGGVVSPILANLFMHYAFDKWLTINMKSVRFCRYADDGVIHCKSQKQAEYVLRRLEERFCECGLELHPDKTKIVYCKDENRTEIQGNIQFTFLGYTFRPRRSKDKYGRVYLNFLPAVSRDALKSMRQTIRSWHIQLMCDKEIEDIANMFNPVLRGWHNYYSKFYSSEMYGIWKHMNWYLSRWMMRKHKKLARHKRKARYTLGELARENPNVLVHWKLGYLPSIG